MSGDGPDPDGLDLDALYAAPPARFVEERKRLARALRAAGRRAEAQSIEKLSRPTVSVWATNQLARREQTRVGELLELTDRLSDIQGRGDGGLFAQAADRHRAVLAALRTDAERLLEADGHAATPQLLGRVVANLRAAAAAPELRTKLAAGRLEGDAEDSGFLGLLAAGITGPSATTRPTAAAKPAPASSPKVPHAANAKAEAARRRAEEAAARAAERARAAELARAERVVQKLRGELAEARRALARETSALEEARTELRRREQALDAARGQESQASERLAAAEAELER